MDVDRTVNSLKSKGWILSVANGFTNERAFYLRLNHYNEIEVDGRPLICEYLEHLIRKGRAMKTRTISTVLIVLLLSGCAGRNATEIGTANGALLGAATGAAKRRSGDDEEHQVCERDKDSTGRTSGAAG